MVSHSSQLFPQTDINGIEMFALECNAIVDRRTPTTTTDPVAFLTNISSNNQ